MREHPPATTTSSNAGRIAGLVALVTAASAAVAGLIRPAGIHNAVVIAAASITAGVGAALVHRAGQRRPSPAPMQAPESTQPTGDGRLDELTGLPDRATTQKRLLSIIGRHTPFTIAIADIDNFGRINETAGREAGDQALRILAATARRAVRPIDTVGRIGGDELLFIFPDTTTDDAVKALERLREDLFIAQTTQEVAAFTLSVGVISSAYGGPIEKILMNAADALQLAKAQGGNRVGVAPSAPVG